ncbi:MAG: thioredoxin family protein [Proteobacteria bacterium]|nr:thioredoxin family protein [Pseudomonadota bacterium]
MVERRFVLKAMMVGIGALAAPPVFAFESGAFDAKAFAAAQAAGKPILIEVTAPWCPTCKAQKPILSELARKPKFKDLVAFQIDFDSQKDLLRKFGVSMQSTLISFKGSKEVDRSTGNTDAASIEAQLDKSL